MARAVWSGTISFGLVSVPVRLYPATRRQDIRFHEIDRSSGQRIRHQKVVEVAAPTLPALRGGGDHRTPSPVQGHEDMAERGREVRALESFPPMPQPVAAGDVVKGFEVAKDRYVTVAREELEELAPERSRTIDVEQFVDASAIDPIYYETSYYAVPDRDYERAYGLLVDAMRETKRVAICWFVLRRKRYLAALRPHGRLMVLALMFHADEILPAAALAKALGIAVVLGRDPVEPNVTVLRSVDQAGVEERGAHAMVSQGRIDEEVVHDQDAIGDQCIDTRIQAGETLKSAIRVGDQLHPETGILFEEIEQRLDLGRVERRAVEGEVALDQAERLGAILPF